MKPLHKTIALAGTLLATSPAAAEPPFKLQIPQLEQKSSIQETRQKLLRYLQVESIGLQSNPMNFADCTYVPSGQALDLTDAFERNLEKLPYPDEIKDKIEGVLVDRKNGIITSGSQVCFKGAFSLSKQVPTDQQLWFDLDQIKYSSMQAYLQAAGYEKMGLQPDGNTYVDCITGASAETFNHLVGEATSEATTTFIESNAKLAEALSLGVHERFAKLSITPIPFENSICVIVVLDFDEAAFEEAYPATDPTDDAPVFEPTQAGTMGG